MSSLINLKSLAIIIILLVILSMIIILTIRPSSPTYPVPSPVTTIQPTSYPNLVPPPVPSNAPINTDFIDYDEEYKKSQEQIYQQEKPILDRSTAVANFRDKLPYTGQFISVTYNIYAGQINLQYQKNNKQQALDEFVKLLKDNQIENIDWLPNLIITEK